MLFKLVEYVDDDVVLVETENVIRLTAESQKDLCPIVNPIALLTVGHFREGIVWQLVLDEPNFIDEIHFVFAPNFKIDTGIFLVYTHLGVPVLPGQLALHPQHGFRYGGGDKVLHFRFAGKSDQPHQSSLPESASTGTTEAVLDFQLQAAVMMAFNHQGSPHPQCGNDHDDGEGQGTGDGHGLQRAEAAGEQQYRCDGTFGGCPEYPLPDRRLQSAAGGQ